MRLARVDQLAPRPIPGRPRRIGPDQQDALRAQLEKAPDATLAEHVAAWAASSDQRLSLSTMDAAIRRLGWTRKKKVLYASEQDPAKRAAYRAVVKKIRPIKLVFVDETAATIRFTRRYARAHKSQRAVDHVPRNHGTSTSLVGALTPKGLVATDQRLGAFNGASFGDYLREVLGPALRPGQVVVMDNASIHKGKAIREAIEQAGARLVYLPPYSPDYSPIEPAFAKRKEALRKAGARTQPALEAAIAAAIPTITAKDARGYFNHTGYLLP